MSAVEGRLKELWDSYRPIQSADSYIGRALMSQMYVFNWWRCRLPPDDGEEDPVGVQAHPPRQLAGASAELHRRSAAGAHRPAGVALLLRVGGQVLDRLTGRHHRRRMTPFEHCRALQSSVQPVGIIPSMIMSQRLRASAFWNFACCCWPSVQPRRKQFSNIYFIWCVIFLSLSPSCSTAPKVATLLWR